LVREDRVTGVRWLALVAAVLVVTAAACFGVARGADSPFYVVPPQKATPTHECRNLGYCYGVKGPWVVVPPHAEATFLLGCPERAATKGAYLLGGADSRASSPAVRVWYDGRLGTPLGVQTTRSSLSGLLFHATADNGKAASFQPVVGCISLKEASKRSTISARAAMPPSTSHAAPPPAYRVANVILAPGWDRVIPVSCHARERLVGAWSAVAYGTSAPPVLPPAGAVRTAMSTSGRTARADVRTATSVPYLIRIQVGALCES
jgi:hypothetical protein